MNNVKRYQVVLGAVLLFLIYGLAGEMEFRENEHRFNWCMEEGTKSVITDDEITRLIRHCEQKAGYAFWQREELP